MMASLLNFILAFCLVVAHDLLEDRCTIYVIITKFPSAFLKWRKDLRIKIIFYVTRQKIRYKKGFAEELNRFEKQEEER